MNDSKFHSTPVDMSTRNAHQYWHNWLRWGIDGSHKSWQLRRVKIDYVWFKKISLGKKKQTNKEKKESQNIVLWSIAKVNVNLYCV